MVANGNALACPPQPIGWLLYTYTYTRACMVRLHTLNVHSCQLVESRSISVKMANHPNALHVVKRDAAKLTVTARGDEGEFARFLPIRPVATWLLAQCERPYSNVERQAGKVVTSLCNKRLLDEKVVIRFRPVGSKGKLAAYIREDRLSLLFAALPRRADHGFGEKTANLTDAVLQGRATEAVAHFLGGAQAAKFYAGIEAQLEIADLLPGQHVIAIRSAREVYTQLSQRLRNVVNMLFPHTAKIEKCY